MMGSRVGRLRSLAISFFHKFVFSVVTKMNLVFGDLHFSLYLYFSWHFFPLWVHGSSSFVTHDYVQVQSTDHNTYSFRGYVLHSHHQTILSRFSCHDEFTGWRTHGLVFPLSSMPASPLWCMHFFCHLSQDSFNPKSYRR